MKFAIVTGESKGLGKSAAEIFLQLGIHVIGISRTGNEELTNMAKQNQVTYEHYSCDLADVATVEKTALKISNQLFKQKPTMLYVVNNAAVLHPIDQAMNISGKDLSHHVQVNTIAPMILMNLFLQKATQMKVPLIGVTVTSGAAERPVYGWSAYCSTKASMNMYTKTVALEQDERETGNKVIAFSPGIMDTNMQEQIRATSPNEFIQVDQFRDYKKNNLLMDTDSVGKVLVNILTDDENIENGKIYNVAEYF